jgi:pyruvate carboxylase
VDGFRHVEVQVLGDGTGAVRHLWERECSIQRRYQKVVEIAPSTLRWSSPSRGGKATTSTRLVHRIIDAALRMARRIRYASLGTFEFLANPATDEFFFLEINPRLQVEHTITEAISGVDIVQAQLAIAQGARLDDPEAGLVDIGGTVFAQEGGDASTPHIYAVQLRLTAENVDANWSLSVGRISDFHLPSGAGIRVDTALISGRPAVVTSDFDSLIAKIIVSAGNWAGVVRKARCALQDTHISGINTNLDVLRAIVASPVFECGECDTEWLEANMSKLLESGHQISQSINKTSLLGEIASDSSDQGSGNPGQGLSSSAVVFRKGDSWKVNLTPEASSSSGAQPISNHLRLSRVLRNDFPFMFSADIYYASPSDSTPRSYRLDLTSTQASSASTISGSKHRRGNPSDPQHVVTPFPGRLVEVLVDEGDQVAEGDVLAVVQQMKMELDIRSPKNGRVAWVTEAEDGEDVAEGMLILELQLDANGTNGPDRPKL